MYHKSELKDDKSKSNIVRKGIKWHTEKTSYNLLSEGWIIFIN